MMLILDRLSRSSRPLAVALGTFDGMHTGHVALIRSLVGKAGEEGLEPAVLTFDRHPLQLLKPKASPELLSDAAQRRLIGSRLGLAQWAEIPFTEDFASMQPGEFIHNCLVPANTALVMVGFNYRFGARGAGTPDLLESMGADLGFKTVVVPAVESDGLPVSSSRIREAVRSGSFSLAEKLLGRPYALAGAADSCVFRPWPLACLPGEGSYTVNIRIGEEVRTTGALLRGGLFYLSGDVPDGLAELSFLNEKS